MTDPVHLSVAEAYDRWASGYDAYDNPMVFAAGRALSRRLPEAKAKRVAEIGCGTGRNLAAFEAAGAARLWGCDLSQGMLARARERVPGAELVRHDMAEALPLPDGAVDLVLFALALEHAGDLDLPLAEAARILVPGGRVLILEIHPFLSLCGVKAHFRDGAEEIQMPTHAHRFCDYLDAFAAAGLAVETCREWTPAEFGPDAPEKLFKRGAETPILVEFALSRP